MNKYLKKHQNASSIKEKLIRNLNQISVVRNSTKSIEFNEAADILLEEYSENTKDPILEFFQTADLNGDGSLDFGEFTRILRHVHETFYIKHKHRQLQIIFNKFSEIDDESGEDVITPLKFKELSMEYNLFTPDGQAIFLEKVGKRGIVHDVSNLREKWKGQVKPVILRGLRDINNDELTIFGERLEGLVLSYSEKNKHKIWLNYKILEGEIERIHIE